MMMNNEDKSIEEFLKAYSNGQRQFTNWDFAEDGSVTELDLTDVIFENCFLFLDFRNTNLSNSKFISCNIKTADFRGANLKNSIIKNCCVESTVFKGANTENFLFEENYCYGATVGQINFETSFKDSDEKLTDKHLAIDLGVISTTKSLHQLFKEKLKFPDFYGENWDAFWDSITGLVEMPKVLTLTNWIEFENNLPHDSVILKEIIKDFNREQNESKIMIRK